jgi:formylglycine-generating enzyme required for sulfatase activity
VLLVVGGGVLLFHPAMVPSLFKPLDSFPIDEQLPKPSARLDPAPEDEQPTLDFEWVPIPAGEFLVGKREEAYSWKLPAYEILKYEVTNNQWSRFLAAEYDRLVDEGKLESYVPANWGWAPDLGKEPYPPDDLFSHPVVYITWTQAQEFCTRWLAKQPGCDYARLPARTEWEKAARGSKDDRPWPWGDEFFINASGGLRLPRANTKESGVLGTLPVTVFADKDVSDYGVVGMAGNVAEFVGWEDGRYDAGYEGGAYGMDRFDARIGEYTEMPNLTHRWRYVGFRAARPIDDGENQAPKEEQEK